MNPYNIFKFMAFKMDPETAHHMGLGLLSKMPSVAGIWNQTDIDEKYKIKLNCGLEFPFPIGLAAGLDKEAAAIDFFSRLYFGAIEVGTVTPKPQPGNPRPRLFRLIEEESLLNRMGFNNSGMEVVKNNIDSSKSNGKLLGVNLGKNKDTPAEAAKDDYRLLYDQFATLCDYLVINVSSPNTPGLRDLQARESLAEIFEELKVVREQKPCPLFVKVSPDMADQGYEDVVELSQLYGLSGIIATNTTIMPDKGQGGVSGKLVRERSKTCREKLLSMTKGTGLDLIGVGGISTFDDILEFWQKGGKVVQIYTSFIYQGPEILREIKKKIDSVLEKEKCTLQEFITRTGER